MRLCALLILFTLVISVPAGASGQSPHPDAVKKATQHQIKMEKKQQKKARKFQRKAEKRWKKAHQVEH